MFSPNTIHNVEAKTLLSGLEDVDLILTDPPYAVSRENGFQSMGRNGIDFGEWDKPNDDMFDWIPFAANALKKGGSLICMMDYKKLGDLVSAANACGLQEKDVLVWNKTNPMPRNLTRRYLPDKEFALWLVKPGSKWTFNMDGQSLKKTVFHSPVVPPQHERQRHPTEKPLEIIRQWIRTHSNSGELVVDPFCGSGTVGIAAKVENRNFIIGDSSTEWYTVAANRCRGSQ